MSSSLKPHTHRQFLCKSNLSQLIDNPSPSRLGRTIQSTKSNLIQDDQEFNKTASQLNQANFQHHQQCLTNDCLCGRHLGKMNLIKPDLTKATVYQRSYFPKTHVQNLIKNDKDQMRNTAKYLDLNSSYRDSYRGKSGDPVFKTRPEDLLKNEGPTQNLSSYSSQFPGYKGVNQYVKPTDRHTRVSFPLRSRSTYAKDFGQKSPEKNDYIYHADQLKTGSHFYGKTTYGSFFHAPNPEYRVQKVKNVEKRSESPGYARQYETNYRNEFIPKENPLCPSKVYLQTKAQGSFDKTKDGFAENSDFKSLSPTFHAISTSKHSFV